MILAVLAPSSAQADHAPSSLAIVTRLDSYAGVNPAAGATAAVESVLIFESFLNPFFSSFLAGFSYLGFLHSFS